MDVPKLSRFMGYLSEEGCDAKTVVDLEFAHGVVERLEKCSRPLVGVGHDLLQLIERHHA